MQTTRESDFQALYTEHYAKVYTYLAYRLHDKQRAEELAVEVFGIIWEKGLPSRVGVGWLLATARKLTANEYRTRERGRALNRRLREEAILAAQGQDGSEALAVLEALGKLKDKDRELLMLSYWDELTTAELAEYLDCSVYAAGVRLHRARKAFARAVPARFMTERQA